MSLKQERKTGKGTIKIFVYIRFDARVAVTIIDMPGEETVVTK